MKCYSYITVILTLIHLINANQTLQCGDWFAFKDKMCFKVLENTVQNYLDAINTCSQYEGSSLITIHSQEVQDFLYNLIHNDFKLVNDVWIGAEYKENKIKWSDNETGNYTNWLLNNPVVENGYSCIQMSLNHTMNGKWENDPCFKKNLVVCQKQQNWLYSYMQKCLIDLRESFENYVKKTNAELENNKIRMENTENLLLEKTKEATPLGTIAYFTDYNAPKGWIKANGQSVSRIDYANLFSSIGAKFGSGDGNTTFTLHDFRGEFIRGWSDNSDVDKDRSFGSFQWGSTVPMAGRINHKDKSIMANAYANQWNFAGETFDNGFERDVPSESTQNGLTLKTPFAVHVIGTQSDENITDWNLLNGNRPRNIALLACIKY